MSRAPLANATSASGPGALPTLAAARERGVPIVMLTAYDYPSARVAMAAGVDVVLVGDSAANTLLGYTTTRDITVDELLVLTRAARRGVEGIPFIGDLPFGSYEPSDATAVATARRFVTEGGCDAVKLEGAGEMVSRVRAIIDAGIPVVGHVGLLPQSVVTPDGYRAQGRDAEQALRIIADAQALAEAGCAALIVEAVPADVTALITSRVSIPVIGIGAGAGTNGQVLVYHDLLGLTEGHVARFVQQYAQGRAMLEEGARRWADDVRAGRYPTAAHTYAIAPEALALVKSRLSS
ncbi:MAG TPA: 3-methyl-2-oxobutanoate hydroxymethyltransferase [Gemmatimonadaceae bacterium]|jgi:3-methyl-2-oxobutanoate hydroxymethyltransferase|nr:3-methyl-2-oxobutanoate hydroxymethyltransferase [Gemmatimonadaceae bacterium]